MNLQRNQEPSDEKHSLIVRAGEKAQLQKHVVADEAAFVRWYTDAEIAYVLRHDLRPLTPYQAQGYFTSIVLPNSAHGTAWAIHNAGTGLLVGTTAITEVDEAKGACLFRIVIGEKECWGQGLGTDATRLVVAEAFDRFQLHTVNLEVFAHNERAQRSYERVGFVEVSRTEEWAHNTRLDVIGMKLTRDMWDGTYAANIHEG